MGMVVSAAISAVPFVDQLEQPYPLPPAPEEPQRGRKKSSSSVAPQPRKVPNVEHADPPSSATRHSRPRPKSKKVVTITETGASRKSSASSGAKSDLDIRTPNGGQKEIKTRGVRKDTGPPKPLAIKRAKSAHKRPRGLNKEVIRE